MPRQVMADSGIRVRAPKVQDSRVAASNSVTLVKPGAMVVQHGCTGHRSHMLRRRTLEDGTPYPVVRTHLLWGHMYETRAVITRSWFA